MDDAAILLNLLDRFKITQSEFSRRCSIDPMVVSSISAGKRKFTRNHISAICLALKVSASTFFADCKEPK